VINSENNWKVETVAPAVGTSIGSGVACDLERQVLQTNYSLQAAASQFRGEHASGRKLVLHLLKEFTNTALALESAGSPAEHIRDGLRASREVFATSSLMRRCQEWPRGQAGDFETIEYLAAGANRSCPGTLG
jgi:hypothetical protein